MMRPKLSVVCVSYKRYEQIKILIHCFAVQTLQNFELIIIHDGSDEKMSEILDIYSKSYPMISKVIFTVARYNDYGHTLRDMGIKIAEGEYILITNDDNYYSPKFMEFMFEAIDSVGADMVLCDMIHSHDFPGRIANNLLITSPRRYSVDIGCFIVKTDLAKSVGFRDKSHDGDATYVEDLLAFKQDIKITKVNRVLFVHN